MFSSGAAHDDFSWDELLACVSEGRVVPVVGREMLLIEVDGRKTLLYTYLASRLAEELRVPIDDLLKPTLEEVAFRYIRSGGNQNKIYRWLKIILEKCSLPIPDPLCKLAKINDFNFFVSTTFDGFLAKALDKVRYDGHETTRSLAYNLKGGNDNVWDLIPGGKLEKLQDPVVYHIFGKLASFPEYAVTEEDTLEFLHFLQSETRRPQTLFDVLQNNEILMLGCNLSRWLVRFFIRTVKCGRLQETCPPIQLVTDDRVQQDDRLVLFLNHYCSQVYAANGPTQFIDELYRRWRSIQPKQASKEVDALTGSASPREKIFISYAREDRNAARKLRASLEAAGLEAWLDESDIPPASDWDSIIKSNIQHCSIFIPCLSRQVRQRESYFRGEWELAIKRSKGFNPEARFLWPVIIDDLPEDSKYIPDGFRSKQMTRLQGGQANSKFLNAVKQEIRDIRSSNKYR